MNTWVLLLAAGSGKRMANATQGTAKQFLMFENEPLYWASAKTIHSVAQINGIIFVFPAERLEEETLRLQRLSKGYGLQWMAVAGGAERQDSTQQGLKALPPECTHVLVHDSARPFATAQLYSAIINQLAQNDGKVNKAVIPALAIHDTVKQVHNQHVEATLDRTVLYTIQTPQGFERSTLDTAHAKAQKTGFLGTDDASLIEQFALAPVSIVTGEANNKKITTPADLALLSSPSHKAPRFCSGLGYDVHRFVAKQSAKTEPVVTQGQREFKLGGVPIPGAPAIIAHSDGDGLIHALIDGILGCLALGDIGNLFPDSDPAFNGISSMLLLDKVLQKAFGLGFSLNHVDITIITQVPKIAPWSKQIKANLCRILQIDAERVNIKATTEEHLGFVGEKKGIKVFALVNGYITLLS